MHPHTRWEFFDIELWNTLGAYTKAPGLYDGAYTDPDTQEKVADQSRKYILAVERKDLTRARQFLKEVVGPLFRQKCIYFEVKGEVEYVFSNLKKIGLFP
ncbi:MAG: hypothetical protein Q8L46_02160 [candidate division WWE3 bacterium]|nr:hypothetical protein [candidate division WWE3 bacterium]